MIVSVRGPVLSVGLDRLVVEVGGVGLLVHTTLGTAAGIRAGSEAALATSLVVREDSWTLYGFGSADEKEVFQIVQTVAGIGPKLALTLLSVLTPNDIRTAIARSDLVTLVKVPGIGKRSAERMVLELRDKIGAAVGAGSPPSPPTTAEARWRGQVKEALVGLGWSAKQAEDAVTAVEPKADNGASVPELLRAALQELGR